MKAEQFDNLSTSLPRFPVSRLVGHNGAIEAAIFTADGKYCLTGGTDRTVRLWNPSRLDPAYHPSTIPPANSKHDVDRSWNVLPRCLPIQTYTEYFTHPIHAIATGTDEFNKKNNNSTQQWLLSASGKTAVLTDLVTGTAVRRFQGHYGNINAVAFSLGAETYLTGSYDATVRIWDGRNRNSHEPIQIFKEAKDSVTTLQIIQGSGFALIRTGSVDGCVRTYDLRMGIVQCDDCGSPVLSMASTIDKTNLAISCLDGSIRLVDCGSGEMVNVYQAGHVAGNYSLDCVITSDDSAVITGSESGEVVFYDLVSATIVQRLSMAAELQQEQTKAPTCSLACHPKQSDVILACSYNGNSVVWAHNDDFVQ